MNTNDVAMMYYHSVENSLKKYIINKKLLLFKLIKEIWKVFLPEQVPVSFVSGSDVVLLL